MPRPDRPVPSLATVLVALCTLAACSREQAASDPTAADPGASGGPLAELAEEDLDPAVADAVRLLTPPPATATSDVYNAWLDRRRKFLADAPSADPSLGEALIARLREHPDAEVLVRDGLLRAGSYAAPEYAEPLLAEAVGTYGGGELLLDLGLRGTAAELLAEIAPEHALELVRPMLSSTYSGGTLPSRETLLRAYLEAASRTETSAAEVLALVATDNRLDDTTRHLAVKRLGDVHAPIGRQALVQVLTESTGNGYLRRLAAQSVARSLEPMEAIAELEGVLQHEADQQMQVFLIGLLDTLEP